MIEMRLEKYSGADEALFSRLVFNEDAMKMNYGRIFTVDEEAVFFRAMLEANASQSLFGYYKVYSGKGDGGGYIGMAALNMNEEHGAAEIEYMLLPEYWNRGYGTELAGILIGMAGKAGVSSSVIAITDPKNLYSRKILEKHGFAFVKRYLNGDGDPAELYRREL